MITFKTTVGPRGRVTIPAAIQRAVGITEGTEVIVRMAGPGVIVVETPQAVKDGIRAGIHHGKTAEAHDAVAEIRALRDGDSGDPR